MPKKITKAVETTNTEKKTAEKPKKETATKKASVAKKTTTTTKGAPAKKVVTKKTTPAKKEAVAKKTATKASPTKKEETKKVEAKKTTPAKKETVAKKTTAKVSAAKKVEPKKTTSAKKATTTKKTATKKVETKSVAKKTITKKLSKKDEQYNKLSDGTLYDLAKTMGVDIGRDDIVRQLITNPDVSKVSAEIVKKYDLKGKYTFENDGYDEGLIEVLVQRAYDSADVKPTTPEDLKAEIDQAMAYKFTDDVSDGQEYKRQFDVMRKVLMIAQNKDIHDSTVLDDEVSSDVEKFVVEFMDLAYSVLKTWKYEDVDYYEHFIFAVLSQLENIHGTYNNRILMDVADLYILHGDYGKGDADYGYILRENQIKDYIYYRFASIYEDVDRDKARQIASGALQYVDDRYTYYPNIIAILEG